MTRYNSHSHPDLDLLLAYDESNLEGDQAQAVADHLESCTLCRLEIKRYHRFESLDDEDEAITGQAEVHLDALWREKIQPAVATTASKNKSAKILRLPRATWLIPAAAAALLVMMVGLPRWNNPENPIDPGREILRGVADAAEPGIILDAPIGELSHPPLCFSWHEAQADSLLCEHFTLEIFTDELKVIFSATELSQPDWSTPDELLDLLEPGKIYLWSVRGYGQLEVKAESGSGWFSF